MMKMATGDDFPLQQGAGTGSRLVFVATEACGGGTSDLGLSPGFLEYLGTYRAKRRCGRPPRWAQPTWRTWGPLWHFFGPLDVFWSKKISKKFHCIWTPFGIDFLRCKKQAKTASCTRHYVNRLVPKNDIKLL